MAEVLNVYVEPSADEMTAKHVRSIVEAAAKGLNRVLIDSGHRPDGRDVAVVAHVGLPETPESKLLSILRHPQQRNATTALLAIDSRPRSTFGEPRSESADEALPEPLTAPPRLGRVRVLCADDGELADMVATRAVAGAAQVLRAFFERLLASEDARARITLDALRREAEVLARKLELVVQERQQLFEAIHRLRHQRDDALVAAHEAAHEIDQLEGVVAQLTAELAMTHGGRPRRLAWIAQTASPILNGIAQGATAVGVTVLFNLAGVAQQQVYVVIDGCEQVAPGSTTAGP